MEKMPSHNELLPPPTGQPVPAELLGNLPLDPTLRPHSNGPESYDWQKLYVSPDNSTHIHTAEIEDNALTDVGKLDLSPLVNSSRVSYHGLRAVMADRKMKRAGNRLEKMDHKDSLYAHLGTSALGDTIAFGQVEAAYDNTLHEKPKPRTFAERYIDKRIYNKQFKKHYKAAERGSVKKAFANNEFADTKSIRSKAVGVASKRRVGKEYKKGNLTAHEMKMAKFDIKTNPYGVRTPAMRKAHRRSVIADLRLKGAAKQPILNKWREHRRRRAINTIKTSHRRAENHRSIADQIRSTTP